MKHKALTLSMLLALCCAAFSACSYTKDNVPQERMNITVQFPYDNRATKTPDSPEDFYYPFEGYIYTEVHPETVQALDLSLESCDGLTEIGKIKDTSSGKNSRLVYDEQHPEGRYIGVTQPKVAYAYPDPRYPNLVVASVDGEAVIFNFTASHESMDVERLHALYGPVSANEINISVFNGSGKSLRITDPEALRGFSDAFNSLSDADWNVGSNYPSDTTGLLKYGLKVKLSNGFVMSLTYYPTYNFFKCG